MNHKSQYLQVIGLIWVSLLLAACAASPPTPTAIPPTPVPTATPAPTVAPTEAVTAWDYLALGDSRTGGSQFPRYYAGHIENDLGIEVNLHNPGSAGQDSDQLLWELQNNDRLREVVSEAEVVTVWTGGMRAWAAYDSKGTTCDRLLEATERDLDDIVDEILALRGDNDTLIRFLEDYHFQVAHQRELGFFEEKKACIEAVNALVHQTAAEYGIPVAPVYAAFNGPDGELDPEAYLRDKTHPNEEGDAIIADLLRELGYEVTAP